MRTEAAKKIYTVIKIIIFFCVLLLLIIFAGKVVQRKESTKKYADFMEVSKQIDVFFLGSSHVLNGINPFRLYRDYGITSYNMAKNGGHIAEAYWTLMNALEYASPKCVVLDLWSLDRDYQYIDIMEETTSQEEREKYISFLHDGLDYWPMNKMKMDAINDLLSSDEVKKEFYWDFIVYHDRWSSLKKEDFTLAMGMDSDSECMGARPVYWVHNDFTIHPMERNTEVLSKDVVSVQYFYRILEECKKREIEVILTYLPMASFSAEDWKAVNTAQVIAEEEELLFLNLLPHEEQGVINYRTDMFDESHANINGMSKLTSYVGKYISELECIRDHRMDSDYHNWNDKVEKWYRNETQKMLAEKDLYLELAMIQSLKANAIVFMRGDSQALQDAMVQELVMQLAESQGILEAAEAGGPYLMIRDTSGEEAKIQEFIAEQQIESFESILGDTEYIGVKAFGAIYVDGNLEHNYLNMEEHYNSEVQILILENDGNVLEHLIYDPNWENAVRVSR